MADHSESESEVPEGAAVLPLIPPEIDAHPLLLAVLHAAVFLAGSEDDVVDSAAGREALEHLATYLQRLRGAELDRVRADLDCVVEYARQQQWPRHEVQFFKRFLADFGVEAKRKNHES